MMLIMTKTSKGMPAVKAYRPTKKIHIIIISYSIIDYNADVLRPNCRQAYEQ